MEHDVVGFQSWLRYFDCEVGESPALEDHLLVHSKDGSKVNSIYNGSFMIGLSRTMQDMSCLS